MARRKKGSVRKGHGARCLICGRECGRGGSLRTHVEGAHHVIYKDAYKRCFFGGDCVFNEWQADKTGDILVHTRVLKVPAK
jgi:hypothetical protein